MLDGLAAKAFALRIFAGAPTRTAGIAQGAIRNGDVGHHWPTKFPNVLLRSCAKIPTSPYQLQTTIFDLCVS